MNSRFFFAIFCLLCLASCVRTPDTLEPKIDYVVQDRYLKSLPSPFPPLTSEEKEQAWGKETQIGLAFAHQLDLYQAITAFKRAEILIPASLQERKREIQYEILLCYYYGKKFADVIYTFENSDLRHVDQNFPAFHDLLVILYDVYTQEKETVKAENTLKLIQTYYPTTQEKLALSNILKEGNLSELKKAAPQNKEVSTLLACYDRQKKSVSTAKTLNALLPGTGYLYIGQRNSAFTAFMLNGLFIAASVHFYQSGNIAAGTIFTLFEAGWYFGGIYGAGQEAKLYNERLYEKIATPVMNRGGLFPLLTLQYSF